MAGKGGGEPSRSPGKSLGAGELGWAENSHGATGRARAERVRAAWVPRSQARLECGGRGGRCVCAAPPPLPSRAVVTRAAAVAGLEVAGSACFMLILYQHAGSG